MLAACMAPTLVTKAGARRSRPPRRLPLLALRKKDAWDSNEDLSDEGASLEVDSKQSTAAEAAREQDRLASLSALRNANQSTNSDFVRMHTMAAVRRL